MKFNRILSVLPAACCALCVSAAISLPDIVGDNMVLQQRSDARLWGWATPGAEVSVSGSWAPDVRVSARAGKDGRWDVELPTPEASYGPYTVNISGDGSDIALTNVAVGEVWLASGQSNMEMPLKGFWTQPVEGAVEAIAYSGRYPGIRMAKVPKHAAYTPQARVESPWHVSNPANARDFSALAYFYARALTDLLDVPVGIIDCTYGGSKVEGWQSREQIAAYPEWNIDAEAADSTIPEYARINVMYNAMLHPLIGYNVRGFIWNQGESNVGRHDTYPSHLADMVGDWRAKWGLGELPFYFVELPGWNYSDPAGTAAALFRECQHRAAAMIPSSAIVCTSDLVYPHEVADIHASKKREIGERLAYIAAERDYGIAGMPTQYPTFRSMTVEGDSAVLSFDNTWEGLTPHTDLQGFEAAGADRVFHPATARENPQTLCIELKCPEAGTIEAVRYNFRNFAIGQVHSVLGLPLVPFRTDDWKE